MGPRFETSPMRLPQAIDVPKADPMVESEPLASSP